MSKDDKWTGPLGNGAPNPSCPQVAEHCSCQGGLVVSRCWKVKKGRGRGE